MRVDRWKVTANRRGAVETFEVDADLITLHPTGALLLERSREDNYGPDVVQIFAPGQWFWATPVQGTEPSDV